MCQILLRDNPLLSQMFGNTSSEQACASLRNSVASIGISYDTLSFMHIEEEQKIEIYGLVSNIGGTLG
jgi:hypothetical protein